jgi:hypothetical protein
VRGRGTGRHDWAASWMTSTVHLRFIFYRTVEVEFPAAASQRASRERQNPGCIAAAAVQAAAITP